MAITVVVLTKSGVDRVLNGEVGMTFVVDRATPTGVVHVRDYRFNQNGLEYQIWSLGEGDWKEIAQ